MSNSLADRCDTYLKAQNDELRKIALTDIMQMIAPLPSPMLELVKALEGPLISEDSERRKKGISLLSEVTVEYASAGMKLQDANQLFKFFTDRLQDSGNQTECLLALGALARCRVPLSYDVLEEACSMIFKEVQVQSFPQNVRSGTFAVINEVVRKYSRQLAEDKGESFVVGTVLAFDGEKDPRNLILLFNLVQSICQSFNIAGVYEELFEVIACYFPITFNPPPNDPRGITKQELIEGLRNAMSASMHFVPLITDLLQEKIESNIVGTKKDAIDTFNHCVSLVGVGSDGFDHQPFWKRIREEMYYERIEPELLDSCIQSAESIARGISVTSEERLSGSRESWMHNFLHPILLEATTQIIEMVEGRKDIGARILPALTGSCPEAASYTFREALPIFIAHYQDNVTARLLIIETMIHMINNTDLSKAATKASVQGFAPKLFELFTTALLETETQYKIFGLTGLGLMVQAGDLINTYESEMAMDTIIRSSLHEDSVNVRKAGLRELKGLLPAFSKQIIPLCLDDLREMTHGDTTMGKYHVAFLNLCLLVSVGEEEFSMVMSLATGALENLKVMLGQEKSSYEDASNVLNVFVTALEKLLENTASERKAIIVDTVISPTMPILASIGAYIAGMDAAARQNAVGLSKYLKESSALVRLLVSNASVTVQANIADQVFRALLGDETIYFESVRKTYAVLTNGEHDCLNETPVWEFHLAAIGSIKPEIKLDFSAELCNLCLKSLNRLHAADRVVVCKIVASLVNKHCGDTNETQLTSDWLKTTFNKLESQITGNDQGSRLAHLQAWTWITKALAMRYHSERQTCTDKLITWIDDPAIGNAAAEGFHILMSDYEDCLTKQMHAIVKKFYKQRVFNSCAPVLMQNYEKADEDHQMRYVAALSVMLQHIPRSVLMEQLDKVFPLVLRSLSYPESTLKINTLKLLQNLTGEAVSFIEDNFSDIMEAILDLTSYTGMDKAMLVRISALEVIGSFVTLPSHLTTPWKRRILQAAGKALDDPKRLVRKAAQECRSQWYLL
eukprot:Clim_evm31s232 gene=Clim_evmTU31s232